MDANHFLKYCKNVFCNQENLNSSTKEKGANDGFK